jgi:hypothetical protein
MHFFRNERDAYSDQGLATAREHIQNSVDAIINAGRAASGRIDINIEKLSDTCTRYEISDNGCGMTEEVIRNVFMQIGETTKSGNSTGGFGRARILTHFSQFKYHIYTKNLHVVGKQDRYRVLPSAEYVDGCRMVVFVENKTRYGWEIEWDRKLRKFLSECQLRCSVFINGERFTNWNYKRRESGTLSFGRYYINKSAEGGRILRLVVRVNGTYMFEESISMEGQCILEINPEISRAVLTSNRDGITSQYLSEFRSLVSLLNFDSNSAEKEEQEIIEVNGTGTFIHDIREDRAVVFSNEWGFDIDGEHSTTPPIANGSAIINPIVNLINPDNYFRKDSPVLPSVNEGTGQVSLYDIPKDRRETVVRPFNPLPGQPIAQAENDEVEQFGRDLREGQKEFDKYVDDHRAKEDEQRRAEEKKAAENRLRNRFFSIIIKDNSNQLDDEKLKRKVKRQINSFHPSAWYVRQRPTQKPSVVGGGKAKVLLLWKTLCHFVIDEHLKVTDENKLEWGVGWNFGPSRAASVIHKDVTYFLLNPLDDAGNLHWQITSKEQVIELLLAAVHQVARRHRDYYDSNFAVYYEKLAHRVICRLSEIKKAAKKVSKVKLFRQNSLA